MSKVEYFYQKGNIFTFKRLRQPQLDDVTTLGMKLRHMEGFTPYFEGFNIYVVGSLAVGYHTPKDMDIIITGFYNPTKLFELSNILLNIGINEIGVLTDVFYTNDISVLDRDVMLPEVKYGVLAPYFIEVEIIDNMVTKFRDLTKLDRMDNFSVHTFTYPTQKQLDRAYRGKKYIKVF